MGDANELPLRDVRHSPYGLPWRPAAATNGPIAILVRFLFHIIEAAIYLVLLPVRTISLVSGRGAVWLLRLPFRIVGAATVLLGYVVIAALLLLVVMGVLALFRAGW